MQYGGLVWTHNYCIDVPEQRNRAANVITPKRGAVAPPSFGLGDLVHLGIFSRDYCIHDASARPAFMRWQGWALSWIRSLKRAVWGEDISYRSVLSAHGKHTATQVCDNHSWKMKSAVRQTNCINTYSCVAPWMDTDVREHWSGGQIIYF